MEAVRMAHIGLCVTDLETSLRFYTEGFGFKVVEGFDLGDEVAATAEVPHKVRGRSQMMVKDGTKLELLWWELPGAHGTPSQTRNQLGLTHLVFEVDDLAGVVARLVALGGTVLESTRTHLDRGTSTLDLLYVVDPDGTRIELIERNAVA